MKSRTSENKKCKKTIHLEVMVSDDFQWINTKIIQQKSIFLAFTLPRPIWIAILVVHFLFAFFFKHTVQYSFKLLFGSQYFFFFIDTVFCQIITTIYRIAFIRFNNWFFQLTKSFLFCCFFFCGEWKRECSTRKFFFCRFFKGWQ